LTTNLEPIPLPLKTAEDMLLVQHVLSATEVLPYTKVLLPHVLKYGGISKMTTLLLGPTILNHTTQDGLLITLAVQDQTQLGTMLQEQLPQLILTYREVVLLPLLVALLPIMSGIKPPE
jgi:hypothetical protein